MVELDGKDQMLEERHHGEVPILRYLQRGWWWRGRGWYGGEEEEGDGVE